MITMVKSEKITEAEQERRLLKLYEIFSIGNQQQEPKQQEVIIPEVIVLDDFPIIERKGKLQLF